METILFDKGSKNWQWAVCAITANEDFKDEAWTKDIRDNGLQTTLIINGRECKFSRLVERLMEELDHQVDKRAAELLVEKAQDISSRLFDLERLAKNEAKRLFPEIDLGDK